MKLSVNAFQQYLLMRENYLVILIRTVKKYSTLKQKNLLEMRGNILILLIAVKRLCVAHNHNVSGKCLHNKARMSAVKRNSPQSNDIGEIITAKTHATMTAYCQRIEFATFDRCRRSLFISGFIHSFCYNSFLLWALKQHSST